MQSSYGTWWDPAEPHHKVAGHLTWEPLRPPTLSLLEPPTGMWAGADLRDGIGLNLNDVSVPMLHGLLADKGAMTLLDCHFGGFKIGSTSTHQLVVMRAVLGAWMDTPDESFLRRVEVDLPALGEMLGPYPARPDNRLTSRTKKLKVTIDSRRHSWRAGKTEIAWEYKPTVFQRETSSEVSMTPTLSLTSPTPRSIDDWIDDWISPINQLLTIATGSKSNPRSIYVWPRKNLSPSERSATRLELWGRGVGEHEPVRNQHRILFNAGSISTNPGGLGDVVTRTLSLRSDQEIFLSLVTGTISYPERPQRNRYLDLMSALEAFHSQAHGLGPMAQDVFKQKRKDAIQTAKAAGVSGSSMKFIKRWLLSRGTHSLATRLRELAKQAGVLDQWRRTPEELAGLRNDLAHGNAGVDLHLLMDAYEQAFDLARALVRSELGLDPVV